MRTRSCGALPPGWRLWPSNSLVATVVSVAASPPGCTPVRHHWSGAGVTTPLGSLATVLPTLSRQQGGGAAKGRRRISPQYLRWRDDLSAARSPSLTLGGKVAARQRRCCALLVLPVAWRLGSDTATPPPPTLGGGAAVRRCRDGPSLVVLATLRLDGGTAISPGNL